MQRIKNFCLRHEKKAEIGAMSVLGILGAFSFLTGNVAAAPNSTAVYAGLSLVDLVLILLGAVISLAGLYLRHFMVVIAGIACVIFGAAAFYLGV